MRTTMKILGGATVAAVAVTAGVTYAVAQHGDDDATDRAITGEALERARDAALAHTGGGTVTETEDGDEESRYEVEVRLPDGSQVDVQLDEDFQVVSDESDDERDDAADD